MGGKSDKSPLRQWVAPNGENWYSLRAPDMLILESVGGRRRKVNHTTLRAVLVIYSHPRGGGVAGLAGRQLRESARARRKG